MKTKPVGKPDTAYDWITAEDVVRHALAAFYFCCRRSDQDEPTTPKIARTDLAQALAEEFDDRLHHQGYTQKLPGFHLNEYFLRRHEYVDNSQQKLSEIPAESNIHRRAM